MSPAYSPITNETRKPVVTVPSVTLFHNAAITATGLLVLVVNFDVKSRFFGTILDSSIDNNFWNWTAGFALMRRSGAGPSDIILDNQVIGAKPAVKVMPMGDGTALLVADLSAVGASNGYIVSADGDRFPVFNMPVADTTTFPQLRAGTAGSENFTADFGSDFAAPLVSGTNTQLKVFSQRGKVIYVRNGSSGAVLHIDASHSLCQASGSDITMSSADLLDGINGTGQARFQVYVNEDNEADEYLEHAFSFVPQDIYVGLDIANFSAKVKYNPNAAIDGVPAYWSNSRIEADMIGNANLTFRASEQRENEEITPVYA